MTTREPAGGGDGGVGQRTLRSRGGGEAARAPGEDVSGPAPPSPPPDSPEH
jgi:hypothetical protein